MQSKSLDLSTLSTKVLSLRGLSSYYELFRRRPRLRFDGIYTLTVEYVKRGIPGLNFWEKEDLQDRHQHVTYYRSLLFFPHGRLKYLMHVVPITAGTFSSQMVDAKSKADWGVWSVKNDSITTQITIDNRGKGSNYYLELELKLAGTAVGSWNQLVTTGHFTRRMGEREEERTSHLRKDDRIFEFVRYPRLPHF
jgi:hypothetical protein